VNIPECFEKFEAFVIKESLQKHGYTLNKVVPLVNANVGES